VTSQTLRGRKVAIQASGMDLGVLRETLTRSATDSQNLPSSGTDGSLAAAVAHNHEDSRFPPFSGIA
jgi:hypothetical protein